MTLQRNVAAALLQFAESYSIDYDEKIHQNE